MLLFFFFHMSFQSLESDQLLRTHRSPSTGVVPPISNAPRDAAGFDPPAAAQPRALASHPPLKLSVLQVFTKSFCKSQFPQKSVNLSFTILDIKVS